MPLPALTELRQEPRCGAECTACMCRGPCGAGLRPPCALTRSRLRRENAAAWIAARELALPGVRAARKTVERHYFAGAVPTLLQVRITRRPRSSLPPQRLQVHRSRPLPQERELGFVYAPGAPVLPDKIFALVRACFRRLWRAAVRPMRGDSRCCGRIAAEIALSRLFFAATRRRGWASTTC